VGQEDEMGNETQAGSELSGGLGREDQLLRLAHFALWCLDASRGNSIGDVDGGELQDKATELGILIAHEVSEPCCESCNCAEYGFPTTCYRQAEWIEPFEIQFGMR
jgi:hypothetical protein